MHQGAGRLHGRDTDAGYEILIGTSLCNRLTDDLYGLHDGAQCGRMRRKYNCVS